LVDTDTLRTQRAMKCAAAVSS